MDQKVAEMIIQEFGNRIILLQRENANLRETNKKLRDQRYQAKRALGDQPPVNGCSFTVDTPDPMQD